MMMIRPLVHHEEDADGEGDQNDATEVESERGRWAIRAKDAHRGDDDDQEHKVDDDGEGGDGDDDEENKVDDDDDDATDIESGRWAIRGKRCTILCKLLT